MRKWSLSFHPALVAALALLLAACQAPAPTPPEAAAAPTPPSPTRAAAAATPTPAPATATPAPTPAATHVPPSPAQTPTREPNILVSAPIRGQVIQSPVHVAGRARVFEAAVSFELVADGHTLGQGHTTASVGAPEWGTFAADLAFTPPATATTALVRVFSISMKDGSIQDLVEVPVRIQPPPTASVTVAPAPTKPAAATRRLLVYFPKESENNVTFVAVSRDVSATPAVGRAAIEELLKGPTSEERARGLYTPIPEGTRLLSLKIVDGTAYADFDKQLEYRMGGSVRVMAVRRSIELTLKQFSTVQRVVISVEGKTEGVLQP